VSTYNSDGSRPEFFIPNDTAQVVIERTEGSQATELKQEIERFTFILDCIDRAVDTLHDKQKLFVKLRYFQGLPMRNVMEQLDFMEERSAYRLRRKVLDKLLISLNNLLTFK
jgi:DNA-directed RNA polymerase specialized sigma subunit